MDDAALVRLTQDLVQVPSTTENEREAALFLAPVMEAIFDRVTVDDLGNITGIMEGTRPGRRCSSMATWTTWTLDPWRTPTPARW